MGLHFILQHLDRPRTYVRILFVDISSAFNTTIPDTLHNKLTQLLVPTSVCQWITSCLTDRQQVVRLGKFSSSTRTISTGAPQGCILSPMLFSLYMNDCTSKDPSVKLLKFADDSTLISLIQDGDESSYRQEVKELAVWCTFNNLELNTLKTVEMVVDFRRTFLTSTKSRLAKIVKIASVIHNNTSHSEKVNLLLSSHIKIHLHICLEQVFGLFWIIHSIWSVHISHLIPTR